MPDHATLAIRALQETTEDLSALQGDVELLVDVATGKIHHLFPDRLCPSASQGIANRNPNCPVCRAIARLEGSPLEVNEHREAACA